jgi:hypothetical protein
MTPITAFDAQHLEIGLNNHMATAWKWQLPLSRLS